MLVELSVMEQRYHAVMEVISGAPVTEVARRYGVSRQAVHAWLGKYQREGLVGLPHAGKTVTIELEDTTLRIIDQHGELITTVPRVSKGEITRFKAYGTRQAR